VVADIPTGGHVHRRPHARAAAVLTYDGGPVMHSNRTHLIFWTPAGSGLGYDAGYQAAMETFLAGVAADSRKPTNTYGLSGQYHDSQGPAAYNSSYAGAVRVTDPLPPPGCTEPVTGPGWAVCLDDSQLLAEIQHVVAVHRLPITPRDIYFLVTPAGLGSCETSGPTNCALGGSADGSYCGYHSSNPEGTILYAVIPYNAVPDHCQSTNPRPNGSTADPTISTLSHEHNETTTDPLGNAWIDGFGSENGDLCISEYGPALGGTGGGVFNQVIHGRRYYLQNEWSNDDHGCAPRDEPGHAWFAAPLRIVAGRRLTLTAGAADADGSIARYDWFFGSGAPGQHRVASHVYARARSYRIVLRTTDSSGNWAFFARPIKVTRAPTRHQRRPRRRR
jgi:hypothetical protein